MAKCLNCLYINKVSKTPVNGLSSIVEFFLNEKSVSVSLSPNAHSILRVEMTCWPCTLDSTEGSLGKQSPTYTSPTPLFRTQQHIGKCSRNSLSAPHDYQPSNCRVSLLELV